ncbi:MAG: hypothetical protein ABI345_01295 [Jatrophihabitans sp.]
MSEIMWIRSHVELLLQREWDVCRVETDPDGDFPFRNGTAACWVAVSDGAVPMVHVFAHAACGLKSSAKLLREMNEVQGRALSARVTLVDGCVLVSQVVNPIGLTQPVLAQALVAVGGIAEDIGSLLAVMFDGRTPFAPELSSSQEST